MSNKYEDLSIQKYATYLEKVRLRCEDWSNLRNSVENIISRLNTSTPITVFDLGCGIGGFSLPFLYFLQASGKPVVWLGVDKELSGIALFKHLAEQIGTKKENEFCQFWTELNSHSLPCEEHVRSIIAEVEREKFVEGQIGSAQFKLWCANLENLALRGWEAEHFSTIRDEIGDGGFQILFTPFTLHHIVNWKSLLRICLERDGLSPEVVVSGKAKGDWLFVKGYLDSYYSDPNFNADKIDVRRENFRNLWQQIKHYNIRQGNFYYSELSSVDMEAAEILLENSGFCETDDNISCTELMETSLSDIEYWIHSGFFPTSDVIEEEEYSIPADVRSEFDKEKLAMLNSRELTIWEKSKSGKSKPVRDLNCLILSKFNPPVVCSEAILRFLEKVTRTLVTNFLIEDNPKGGLPFDIGALALYQHHKGAWHEDVVFFCNPFRFAQSSDEICRLLCAYLLYLNRVIKSGFGFVDFLFRTLPEHLSKSFLCRFSLDKEEQCDESQITVKIIEEFINGVPDTSAWSWYFPISATSSDSYKQVSEESAKAAEEKFNFMDEMLRNGYVVVDKKLKESLRESIAEKDTNTPDTLTVETSFESAELLIPEDIRNLLVQEERIKKVYLEQFRFLKYATLFGRTNQDSSPVFYALPCLLPYQDGTYRAVAVLWLIFATSPPANTDVRVEYEKCLKSVVSPCMRTLLAPEVMWDWSEKASQKTLDRILRLVAHDLIKDSSLVHQVLDRGYPEFAKEFAASLTKKSGSLIYLGEENLESRLQEEFKGATGWKRLEEYITLILKRNLLRIVFDGKVEFATKREELWEYLDKKAGEYIETMKEFSFTTLESLKSFGICINVKSNPDVLSLQIPSFFRDGEAYYGELLEFVFEEAVCNAIKFGTPSEYESLSEKNKIFMIDIDLRNEKSDEGSGKEYIWLNVKNYVPWERSQEKLIYDIESSPKEPVGLEGMKNVLDSAGGKYKKALNNRYIMPDVKKLKDDEPAYQYGYRTMYELEVAFPYWRQEDENK